MRAVDLRGLSRGGSVGSSHHRARLQRRVGGSHRARGVVSCSVGTEAKVQQQVPQQMPLSHTGPAPGASSRTLKAFNQSGGQSRYLSEKSAIVAIGLSIHRTPVEIREKLAVPEAEFAQAVTDLSSCPHIEEAAVLSTCNRMEVYVMALSWHRGVAEVLDWMCKASGLAKEQIEPYLFVLRDDQATYHLLRVSSGLDSLVLGEGQILAQVKSVFQNGQGVDGFGRNLNGLFNRAVIAGKRVRSETEISKGAVSVSSAAVELVDMKMPEGKSVADAKLCIIGAGTMSRLLVKHAISKGVTSFVLLNRSLPRAEQLAADFPAATFDIHLMDDLLECTAASDVVFTSTGSEDLLYTKDMVADLDECSLPERMYVDISVPRNVCPSLAELEDARVFNVDDLKEVVAANKEARARKAKEAEYIILDERQQFNAWRDSLQTVPTIKRLRSKAEAIRVGELDKTLNKLGDLSKKERKAVEELSRSIVNKLLHGPMQGLRVNEGSDVEAVRETIDNMHALERMFDLKAVEEAELRQKMEQKKK